MSDVNEFLRLPRGMFDRGEAWVLKSREILQNHYEVGKRIGCELISFSPVSFSSTFRRAANTAGERVYQLEDRNGRELMLSPDSTPSLLRHYVNTFPAGDAVRFSFNAPLFRYKNGPTRHFTQIGYAVINEPEARESVDLPLLELAEAAAELCSRSGIKAQFFINDYAVLRNIIKDSGVPSSGVADVLYKLQFAEREQFSQILTDAGANPSGKDSLRYVLEAAPVPLASAMHNNFITQYYGDLLNMADALQRDSNIDLHVDIANLHSVETISKYAIRLQSMEGVHLGDGGIYHAYANKFDLNIKTLRSFATGVEALERNAASYVKIDRTEQALLIINTSASTSFVLDARKHLQGMFSSVSCVQEVENLTSILDKARIENKLISIVGENEEQNREIEVKHPQTDILIVRLPGGDEALLKDKADVLQRAGLNPEIYAPQDKVGNQIKYAISRSIPYALFVASEGSASDEIKDLADRSQQPVDLKEWAEEARRNLGRYGTRKIQLPSYDLV